MSYDIRVAVDTLHPAVGMRVREENEMTASIELRAWLNARGIQWERHETLDIIGHDIATVYRADHAEWIAFEDTDENLNPTGNGVNVMNYRKPLTPEQAIEATLGRGTCRLEREPNSDRLWWCSSCQSYHEHVSEFPWEYCPRCGAKVVE